MKIAAVLVNYHSSSDLLEAAESLEKSLIPNGFERKIFIIENGSPDQEGEWRKLQVLSKYPDIELIKSNTNTGFTGGHNLGIKQGLKWGADYFLLLNPDTKVDKNFLVKLIKPFTTSYELRATSSLGLASPKIYFYPGYEFHKDRYTDSERGKVLWYAGGFIDWDNVVGSNVNVDKVDQTQGAGDKRQDWSQKTSSKKKIIPSLQAPVSNPVSGPSSHASNLYTETDFATGCCLLITKEVVDKIGLLDQKLFFSWEDTDYSVRAKKAGFEVIYVPDSIIWHKNSQTSGGAGSSLQDYYQTRNRLIFAFRYASLKVKLLLFWQLLRTANSNRLRAILSSLKALL